MFEPIKRDLHVSDEQLGVLSGIAVALVGALFGVSIARLADASPKRRTVLAMCLAAWSFFTAISGVARGFSSLLVARIGVGIGEAGAIPISLAILADAYPQQNRAMAMSAYYTGIPMGISLGLFLGGWLSQEASWRTAFLAVGVPGLGLAVLIFLRLREPPRGHADRAAAGAGSDAAAAGEADSEVLLRDSPAGGKEGLPGAGAPPLGAPPPGAQILGLLTTPTFVLVLVGCALNLFSAIGTFAFMPSFIIRRFGTQPGVVGSALSGAMFFGFLSTLSGGLAADAAFARLRHPAVYAALPGLAMAAALPFSLAMCSARSAGAAVALFLPQTASANMPSGPVRCLVSAFVAPHSRGVANSMLEVGIGLAGGLGPLVVGAASDALQARGLSPGAALEGALFGLQFAAIPASLAMLAAAALSQRDLAAAAARDPVAEAAALRLRAGAVVGAVLRRGAALAGVGGAGGGAGVETAARGGGAHAEQL